MKKEPNYYMNALLYNGFINMVGVGLQMTLTMAGEFAHPLVIF